MGEVAVKGGCGEVHQKLIVNDISPMKSIDFYSPMCYPDGGVVDDLLVYKFNKEDYFIVINASNTDKDVRWFMDHLEGNVEVKNVSDDYGELALQGPKAEMILQKLTDTDLNEIGFFRFMPDVKICGTCFGIPERVYREDGFEIYVDPASPFPVG